MSLRSLVQPDLEYFASTRHVIIFPNQPPEEMHAYAILIFTARGAGENHDVIRPTGRQI